MPAPIIEEREAPEDFDPVLTDIWLEFKRTGLSWLSSRVQEFVFKLHAANGFYPTTWPAAYYGLSYSQLQTILKKLKELPNARSH